MSEYSDIVDEMIKEKPNVKTEKKQSINVGLDIGTMNLCCATNETPKEVKIRMIRNVFLQLDKENVDLSQLSELNYVTNDAGQIFILGSEAFNLANIFGQNVSRPMESGLISPKEIYAIDVLTLMIKQLIGDVSGSEVNCCYSVPAEAIDEGRSVLYHEKVFGQILKSININAVPVNEAMAIIYSECAKDGFSGIGISFGAGMANCVVSYRGVEAVKFSTARAGDWIDKNVAEATGNIPNRVTSIKEKYLDLTDPTASKIQKKQTRMVVQALNYYYEALINYTLKKIIREFNEKSNIEIDEAIPIVISGGTSMPNGFIDLFKKVIEAHEFPFNISDIRSSNPLNTVAKGLLVKSIANSK